MSTDRNIEVAVSYVRDINDHKNAEFGTRMIMIPALDKQTEYSLHGDDNNIEISTKKLDENDYDHNNNNNNQDGGYKIVDGPIDLSSQNQFKEMADCHDIITVKIENNLSEDDKKVRIKQKKRKSNQIVEEEWNIKYINERAPRQNVSKKEEVLKAARSLFSKRTRTLYHWMYPDTSKGQLKAIVSAAWDTLSTTEKEFYVSQVLGRFGVPAGSLMVNPQLGGFQNREFIPSPINILNNNIPTSSNVISITNEQGETYKKRWRRQTEQQKSQPGGNHDKIEESYDENEFADDPELTTELIQFRRAMGNAE